MEGNDNIYFLYELRDVQVNYSGQKAQHPTSGGGFGAKKAYGGGQQSFSGEKHTVFVGNLSFKTTENSLSKHFKDCGPIVAVRIALDRDTGKMKGFGHIDFDSADSVNKAINKNGLELDGRPLKVDASTAKPGGNAGGRGGFGGGRGGRGGGRGGRGGGDPLMKAQKSGAIIDTGKKNVTTFDEDDD